MTIGEKIKLLRVGNGITQEELAEKLNVSRSAIAKWETDNGTPEISNLKLISKMSSISLDDLLNDERQIGESSAEDNKLFSNYPDYSGYYYTINLKGWNDGVSDTFILGEDKDFIYYQKENGVKGLIGKKYVTSLKKGKQCSILPEKIAFEGRKYFCLKPVFLEVSHKEGFIEGFLDFRNYDYLDVEIISFLDSVLCLKGGMEISIDTITKIEELTE